jgi:hypothetical protein
MDSSKSILFYKEISTIIEQLFMRRWGSLICAISEGYGAHILRAYDVDYDCATSCQQIPAPRK